MVFISTDASFATAKEPVIAPEGTYDLEIIEADEYLSLNSGGRSIRVRIRFTGKSEYANLTHYLGLANKEKDAARDAARGVAAGSTAEAKALMTKRFLHAFGIKWDAKGYDTNAFATRKARLDVTIDTQEMENGTVRKSNSIRLPALPEGKA